MRWSVVTLVAAEMNCFKNRLKASALSELYQSSSDNEFQTVGPEW